MMNVKSRFSELLINERLMRWILLIRPRRLLFRFLLSSLIVPKKSVVTIVSGSARGLKMALSIGDPSKPQETHYWLGFHELEVQELFCTLIEPSSVIYDIGAYLGLYALLAGRSTGPTGKVFTFEPLPQNADRIEEHVLLNKMEWVRCVAKAVADKGGTAQWVNFGRGDWARFADSKLPEKSDKLAKELLVEAVSLDDFVYRESHPVPNLIKIDVEGAEGKVLVGARRLLKEFKPIIICELHGPEPAREVYQELNKWGYQFEDLSGAELVTIPNYGHVIARPRAGE